MTITLYRRNGAAPAELPVVAYDANGNAYTAPYADADLAYLGFVLAPPRPDDVDAQTAEWDADAEAWVMVDRPPPPPAPEPRPLTVDAERDRRIAAGMVFADHPFQTDTLDRERIDRSRISAIAAIMGGAQKGDYRWHGLPVDFFWIAADNDRIPMDAQTMVAFGNAVAAREGLLIVAGNDLKARIAGGEEIADVTEDALWPA